MFFAGIARTPIVAIGLACFDARGRRIDVERNHLPWPVALPVHRDARTASSGATCCARCPSRSHVPPSVRIIRMGCDRRSSCVSSFAPTGAPARPGRSQARRSRLRCTRSSARGVLDRARAGRTRVLQAAAARAKPDLDRGSPSPRAWVQIGGCNGPAAGVCCATVTGGTPRFPLPQGMPVRFSLLDRAGRGARV